MMLEGEEGALRLDSYDKIGRNFARALRLTVEDVGTNYNYRQVFLDVTADCFANILRLSNSITGCQGAVNNMLGPFVETLGFKASQIAESIAQYENMQEENQEVIEKAEKLHNKKLLEDILHVYAESLSKWRLNADSKKTYHQARALIQLALNLRCTSKDALQLNKKLVEVIMWLGESVNCTRNAPKSQII